MEQLASLQLHAGARTERHSRLIHLIPEQKMRDWAARCKHDHDHFAKKVGPGGSCHLLLKHMHFIALLVCDMHVVLYYQICHAVLHHQILG